MKNIMKEEHARKLIEDLNDTCKAGYLKNVTVDVGHNRIVRVQIDMIHPMDSTVQQIKTLKEYFHRQGAFVVHEENSVSNYEPTISYTMILDIPLDDVEYMRYN